LLSILFTSFVLAIVYQNLVTLWVGMSTAANMAQSEANNRSAVDTMADHVRNATVATSTGAVLSAATASSFTYYTSAAGATVQYALSGGNLVRTPSGGSAVTVAYGITSLTITYYLAAASTAGSTYAYETGPLSTMTTTTAPTTAQLPSVAAMTIVASSTLKGVPTTMTTTVRLRNSPVKTAMSGL
jgi:hypothetical protein